MTTRQGIAAPLVPETLRETTKRSEQSRGQQTSSSPTALKRDNMKSKRRVHWDAGVIDNQGKTTYNTKKAKDNIIVLPWTKDPTIPIHRLHSVTMVPTSSAKNHHKSHKIRIRSEAMEIKASSRQPSFQTHEKTQNPVQFRRPALSQRGVKRIPPAVPDPPRREGPPPAPRPARLPTPDLPEARHGMFGRLPPLGAAIDKSDLMKDNHLVRDQHWKQNVEQNGVDKMAAQSKKLTVDFVTMLTMTVNAARAYVRWQREVK